ncbi:MAG: hypothetical protein HRU15_18615, partial [Planctomycetes bacterium]|nr:hypothetical protein [Planctomycetota bacterium]
YKMYARYIHSSEHNTSMYQSDRWLPVLTHETDAVKIINERMRQAQQSSFENFTQVCGQRIRSYPLRHRDEITIRWFEGAYVSMQRYVYSYSADENNHNWYDCATYYVGGVEPLRLSWKDHVFDVDQHWPAINDLIMDALATKGASMYPEGGFKIDDVSNVLRLASDLVVYIPAAIEGQRQQGPYMIRLSAQQLQDNGINLMVLE